MSTSSPQHAAAAAVVVVVAPAPDDAVVVEGELDAAPDAANVPSMVWREALSCLRMRRRRRGTAADAAVG